MQYHQRTVKGMYALQTALMSGLGTPDAIITGWGIQPRVVTACLFHLVRDRITEILESDYRI